MASGGRRGVIAAGMTAAAIAILYRYWLVAPVLQYVGIGRWRFLAIVVVAGCGGVSALLRVPIVAVACETMAGLLIGGTWAAFQGPHDVRMTVGDAFLSHLEPFWRNVILFTVVATVSGLCCSIVRSQVSRWNRSKVKAARG